MPRPAFLAALSLPFVVAIIPAASILVANPTPAGEDAYAMDSAVPAGAIVQLASMPAIPDPAAVQLAYGIQQGLPVSCDETSAPTIEG